MLPFLPFAEVLGGLTNTFAGMFHSDSMQKVRVDADVLSYSHLRSCLVVYLNDDEGFVMTLPANGFIH
jgi:hypothetical protein